MFLIATSIDMQACPLNYSQKWTKSPQWVLKRILALYCIHCLWIWYPQTCASCILEHIYINPLTLMDLIYLSVDKIVSLDGNHKEHMVTTLCKSVWQQREKKICVYAFKVKKKTQTSYLSTRWLGLNAYT